MANSQWKFEHNALSSSVRTLWLLFVLLSLAAALHGQDAVGKPAFSAVQPVEFGFINIPVGNVHHDIPVASVPLRSGNQLTLKFTYDSHFWQTWPGPMGGEVWVPNAGAGWKVVSDITPGPSAGNATYSTSISNCPTGGSGSYQRYENFLYFAADGTVRKFPTVWTALTNNCSGPPTQSSSSGFADDASGYKMLVTNYADIKVFAPNGAQLWPGGFKDANGNTATGLSKTPMAPGSLQPTNMTISAICAARLIPADTQQHLVLPTTRQILPAALVESTHKLY